MLYVDYCSTVKAVDFKCFVSYYAKKDSCSKE